MAAVALVLTGVAFVAKSIGLDCPQNVSVLRSAHLRGDGDWSWKRVDHRHHKNYFPPHHDENHENSDNSFDFYIFSSK